MFRFLRFAQRFDQRCRPGIVNCSRRRFRSDILDKVRIIPGQHFDERTLSFSLGGAGVRDLTISYVEFTGAAFVRPYLDRTLRGEERARRATSSSARSRNVPRDIPVSIHGPRSACTAAPNSTSSNGFSRNCNAPLAPRSAVSSGVTPAAMSKTRVSGKKPRISPKNAIAPGYGGSKSRMMSSGFCSRAARRASARDRTA